MARLRQAGAGANAEMSPYSVLAGVPSACQWTMPGTGLLFKVWLLALAGQVLEADWA